jgi:hypothetical protein
MKSTLKILKDNMFTIFVILIFIAGMFVLSYLKRIYWDNNNEAAYGDRTEDVKNHLIDEDMIKSIETSISSLDNVISCKYDLDSSIVTPCSFLLIFLVINVAAFDTLSNTRTALS